MFLNKTEPVSYGEIVQLRLSDGSMIHGRFALVFGALFGLVAVVAREPATGAQPQLKA